MIRISVIGNHRAVEAVKDILQTFGFDTEHGPAHFTVEILKSKRCRILHNDQQELSGFVCGLIQDFGMYEVVQKKRPLKRSNLCVYAIPGMSDIEVVAFGKQIAYALKEFYA